MAFNFSISHDIIGGSNLAYLLIFLHKIYKKFLIVCQSDNVVSKNVLLRYQ